MKGKSNTLVHDCKYSALRSVKTYSKQFMSLKSSWVRGRVLTQKIEPLALHVEPRFKPQCKMVHYFPLNTARNRWKKKMSSEFDNEHVFGHCEKSGKLKAGHVKKISTELFQSLLCISLTNYQSLRTLGKPPLPFIFCSFPILQWDCN